MAPSSLYQNASRKLRKNMPPGYPLCVTDEDIALYRAFQKSLSGTAACSSGSADAIERVSPKRKRGRGYLIPRLRFGLTSWPPGVG